MFTWLSKHKFSPIGLDIGTKGVRMLQLGKEDEKLFVSSIAQRSFPPALAENKLDHETRRRLAIETVGEILKTDSFHGRKVVSCLRADELYVKSIRLPRMSDEELSQAVMWECQERFGFEVSPDRAYYIRAGQVKEGSETRDEIILLAVPESTITAHVEMLSKMHLTPLHIDAEPLALFRAHQRFLQRAEDNASVNVLVDIGLSKTTIIIAKGKRILLIKIIDIGGCKFNESVSEELHMTYSAAAELRGRLMGNPPVVGENQSRNKTSLPEGTDNVTPPRSDQIRWPISDAIRSQVEALAHEVSLCLRYCSVTFRGLRADRITLTGGQAYDRELVKLMKEYLDCDCTVTRPLLGIDLSRIKMETDRRSELTEWSVATGLALKSLLNFDDFRQNYVEPSVVPAKIDNTSPFATEPISRGNIDYASNEQG